MTIFLYISIISRVWGKKSVFYIEANFEFLKISSPEEFCSGNPPRYFCIIALKLGNMCFQYDHQKDPFYLDMVSSVLL